MEARRSSLRCARALAVRALFLLALFPGRARADAALARELLDAGDWAGGRREARRAALAGSDDPEIRYIEAVCLLRLGTEEAAARSALAGVIADFRARGVSDRAAAAALELGASEEAAGRWRPALEAYATALACARTPDPALRAAAGIDRLRKRDPEWSRSAPELEPVLRSLRPAIPDEAKLAPVAAGREPDRGFRLSGFFVSLYRTQVRPAIGDRCEMNPSCSEYFRQAGLRHGWLAFPMIGDRFFREPSVVQAADAASARDRQSRVPDPLDDHDFWHRKEPPP